MTCNHKDATKTREEVTAGGHRDWHNMAVASYGDLLRVHKVAAGSYGDLLRVQEGSASRERRGFPSGGPRADWGQLSPGFARSRSGSRIKGHKPRTIAAGKNRQLRRPLQRLHKHGHHHLNRSSSSTAHDRTASVHQRTKTTR